MLTWTDSGASERTGFLLALDASDAAEFEIFTTSFADEKAMAQPVKGMRRRNYLVGYCGGWDGSRNAALHAVFMQSPFTVTCHTCTLLRPLVAPAHRRLARLPAVNYLRVHKLLGRVPRRRN